MTSLTMSFLKTIALITALLLSACGVGELEGIHSGMFAIEISPSANHAELNALIKDYDAQDKLFESFNKTFNLPSDITISIEDCGLINALYLKEKSQIILCYELLDLLINLYEKTDGLAIFFDYILAHEIAHALIDILDLPIAGVEEDVADAIATVLTIELNNQSKDERAADARTILLAGDFQNTLLTIQEIDTSTWVNKHSIGSQRFLNLSCWAIGGEPSVTDYSEASLFAKEIAESNRDCSNEYLQKQEYFDRFISPYVKNNFKPAILDVPF